VSKHTEKQQETSEKLSGALPAWPAAPLTQGMQQLLPVHVRDFLQQQQLMGSRTAHVVVAPAAYIPNTL
jgi:hypothetical protein